MIKDKPSTLTIPEGVKEAILIQCIDNEQQTTVSISRLCKVLGVMELTKKERHNLAEARK